MFVITRVVNVRRHPDQDIFDKIYRENIGVPFDTLEAANAHLPFVQKTMVGYSAPHTPYQFEVREIEDPRKK